MRAGLSCDDGCRPGRMLLALSLWAGRGPSMRDCERAGRLGMTEGLAVRWPLMTVTTQCQVGSAGGGKVRWWRNPATGVEVVDDVAGKIDADEGLPWRASEQGSFRCGCHHVSKAFRGASQRCVGRTRYGECEVQWRRMSCGSETRNSRTRPLNGRFREMVLTELASEATGRRIFESPEARVLGCAGRLAHRSGDQNA
jgi:hypothetical protein